MEDLSELEVLFKGGLPANCTCPVCEQALREPFSLGCDHQICKACLDGLEKPDKCPTCQLPIDQTQSTYDKEKHREIQNLLVSCSFDRFGCKWEGKLQELKEHTATCEFEASQCRICRRRVPKSELPAHVADCKRSRASCDFCGKTIRRDDLQRHLKICNKVLISCPFRCGLVDRPREEVDQHRPNCPNVDKVCPFVQFGCNFAGDKQAVQNHLTEEPIRHLMFLCDQTADLRATFDVIENEVMSFSSRQTQLVDMAESCNKMFGAQLIWRIDNVMQRFNESKALQSGAQTTLYSTPFMASRHGYKMLASAYLFGDGTSRGRSLSLYVAIMRGEYDGIQEWPFTKIIKISLLDQNPNCEERVNITYTIDPRNLKDGVKFLGRPRGDRNAFFGAQSFCSLTLLDSYIKTDIMYVKIEIERCENAENILLKRNKGLVKPISGENSPAKIYP